MKNKYIKNLRSFYSFLVLLFSMSVYSQTPTIQWQKSLGGSAGETGGYVRQTEDGGYVIAGSSISNDGDVTGNHGSYDYWIVKLDSLGVFQWQSSLGGSGDEIAYSIEQTADKGYIVAGNTSYSNDGDVTGNQGYQDFWIVKVDSSGVKEWQKTLGGTEYETAHSIIQSSDGGYIVTGESESNDGDVTGNHGGFDIWIVKLNNLGVIQWQKSLGGTSYEYVNSIENTTDGGYIVGGCSFSNDGDVSGNHGGWDYWMVKIDSLGVMQWQKCLGGSGDDQMGLARQVSDGGFIMSGTSTSNDGNVTGNHGMSDFWVVKVDSIGDIQWQKSLGGSFTERAWSIQETSFGEYVVVGESGSADGDVTDHIDSYDYWIVNLNSFGAIQWKKSLGGTGSEWARSVTETTDGGFVLAGETQSNDGEVTFNHGSNDYWIVKLYMGTVGIKEVMDEQSMTIYPNPFKSFVNIVLADKNYIKVELYNAFGDLVFQNQKDLDQIQVDLSNYANGLYFVKIFYDEKVVTKRIVKQ
jgi:hypothetical protein